MAPGGGAPNSCGAGFGAGGGFGEGVGLGVGGGGVGLGVGGGGVGLGVGLGVGGGVLIGGRGYEHDFKLEFHTRPGGQFIFAVPL